LAQTLEIRPQPTQNLFLQTTADIALYGGSAGSGKSWSLVVEPLRNYDNDKFGAVIFRRTYPEIKVLGGLWDESCGIYPRLGATPRETTLEWNFNKGMRVKFGHLQHEHSVYDYQGASLPFMGFDELTSFTEKQFFFLLSRNRSTCGVSPYVRATCNPDADSWVKNLLLWYIDDNGDPIPARSGKIRWFIRVDDVLQWADSKEALMEKYGADVMPKSFTFISANIYDNQVLLKKDPGYLANLKALSRVDRLRLLGGNWNVRATAGSLFRKEWFPVVDAIPAGYAQAIRYWDRAATIPSEVNRDPDYSVGVKLLRYPNNTYLISDVVRLRDTPLQVKRTVGNMASHDGYQCIVGIEKDPGQAGVVEADDYVRMLSGFDVRLNKVEKDKITRAKPLSAQVEAGNVKVLRGHWNQDFFNELENFGEDSTGHDDQVDACSGAFQMLSQSGSMFDFFKNG
jgi:predicted phage terminase large subunit-like protein